MQDELIDIISNDLSFVKTTLKSEAHKHGWLHASVHVWFYTSNGELLFQKRNPDKIAFPKLWDVSVAGHIGAGEKPDIAAVREIEEEIGLHLNTNDLKHIGQYEEYHHHKVDFIDHEIHYIYTSKLSNELKNLTIQKEELTALNLIPISKFEKALQKDRFKKTFVSHQLDYYKFILSNIKLDLNL